MIETAKKFVNENGKQFVNLAERWLDERQYEDIKDYKVALQKIADKYGIKIDKMLKRPFGCSFVLESVRYTVKVKFSGARVSVTIEGQKA